MTKFNLIEFSIDQNIATLMVNREDKLNALNKDVLKELRSFFLELPGQVKGIIFTGKGEKAFIAGADIASMSQMTPEEAHQFAKLGQEVTLLIEKSKVPVVAAVNGYALGGGCEMALACDFIFASEKAVFGQPEVKLGIIPGFGGTQRLPKRIGRGLAKELIFSGRYLSALEAKESGLVNRIYPDKPTLLKACREILLDIFTNSPLAVAQSKRVIEEGCDLPTEEGLEKEAGAFSFIFQSEDMREGTTAFVEKRKANFKGV